MAAVKRKRSKVLPPPEVTFEQFCAITDLVVANKRPSLAPRVAKKSKGKAR